MNEMEQAIHAMAQAEAERRSREEETQRMTAEVMAALVTVRIAPVGQ